MQPLTFAAESKRRAGPYEGGFAHPGGILAVERNVDAGVAGSSFEDDACRPCGVRAIDFRRLARRAATAVLAVSAVVAAPALAIGLGPAALNSGLGEPLRLTFPVSLQADEEVGCVQVRARGDDLPSVFNTRSSVLRSGNRVRLEVTSTQPVYEPAIGLVVSVGCAAPISREYVLFLDPPVVPPAAAPGDASVASASASPATASPRRPPRATAPRRTGTEGTSSRSGTRPDAAPAPRPRRRAANPRPPVVPVAPTESTVPEAGTASSSIPTASPPTRSATTTRDRLTVAPTEPQVADPSVGVSPSTPPSVGPASVAPTAAAGSAAGTVQAAVTAGDADAREQALRRQQADLQGQVKAMTEQIAALRVQTKALVERNQVLQDSTAWPWLNWLLLALAALGLLAAAWMAVRYAQLRRSVEGSAWWTGSTVHAPTGATVATTGGDDLGALDAGTRLAQRPAAPAPPRAPGGGGARTSGPSAPSVVSNVERSRPTTPRNGGRGGQYPAAIDTDFTVSDIEAAMATVRTVSPPRNAARAPRIDDSDFAPLGGPTLPSPFTQPPAEPRNSKVVARDGDDVGKFVDLDIPPFPTASRPPASGPQADSSIESEPLDFKLDIPTNFDPLSTDSLKTTVVDRLEPADAVDFELPASPTSLDFELPSTTAIAPLGTGGDGPVRHGATALDDLFPPLGGPGPDTILDLDQRDDSPLSTTEIDRLTTTSVDAPVVDSSQSMRVRMGRFADLMNQVDETAVADPLRAIANLRQYVLRDELIPTLLWLRLFELYKVVDKRPVYEALGEHFSRRYHRPMIEWSQTLADRVPQKPLSAMHDIDRRIEAQWGKEQGLELLRSYLCDRDQDDAIVFNAVLQRDLLDAAKVFPLDADPARS